MTASELVLLCTIRIETIVPNGISTGTGFFFSFLENDKTGQYVPTIVTNKHVIKNAIIGKLRFSLKDRDGKPLLGEFYDLVLDNFESRWIKHPDSSVDLCILPIANIHEEIEKSQKSLYYSMFTVKEIPTSGEISKDFSKIEDITIIGYPDGIWDAYNNMPIVRKGITATALQTDFNNQPEFLVDAAIYGGSSGSPVLVLNQGSYSLPDGRLIAGNRVKLVGIIYAVAQHTVNGEIKIVEAPVAKTSVAITQIPNNLGVAIHARKLKEFEGILRRLL